MGKRKKHTRNISSYILCALVFFVIGGTIFCMVADARENARIQARIQAEEQAEKEKKAAEEAKVKERIEANSVRPGVPVGTLEPDMDEKAVYLTFDDGPSEITRKVLDILDSYGIKATFFITGANEKYRPLIKEAHDKGHTIGLHTYSHDYKSVYSSEESYFRDLEKVGKVAEEQIGYVPCFIRFPGGSSNMVSAQYSPGIMSRLVEAVQRRGYQYYDWNVDSGDGAGYGKEQIEAGSMTDQYHHSMILFHDAPNKADTAEALPQVIEYYKNLGYEFRPITRESFVSHHAVLN